MRLGTDPIRHKCRKRTVRDTLPGKNLVKYSWIDPVLAAVLDHLRGNEWERQEMIGLSNVHQAVVALSELRQEELQKALDMEVSQAPAVAALELLQKGLEKVQNETGASQARLAVVVP